MSHGHLLAMGGFTLVHDPASINPHCTVLTDEIFEKHLKDNQIDFPSVTVPEIVDKSKRDFVAKTIAVFQSTWFIVQCIARGVQGLSLTQLELATLALASLNAVTSIFWLRKPLGLQEPVKVNLKRSEKAKSETSAGESKSPQKLVSCIFYTPRLQKLTGTLQDVDKYLEFSKISEVAWNVFHAIAKGIRDIFQRSCENHPFIFVFQWCLFLPTYILALAFCLPFTFFPFAIVLSLRIVEPFVVLTTMPPHDNHGFLITRIVQYFHEIRFRFTTSISLNFDDWVNKIRSHNHTPFLPIPFFGTPSFIPLHRIFFAWFFILPALFFTLLFLSLLLLAPVLLFLCVLFIFNAAFGILATSRVNEDSTHVPAFYAPDTREGRYSRIVVFALFGVVFGGIHLVGWNFKFPTVIEQHLWRSTSLTITVIPLIVASIDFILVFRQKKMAPFATVVLLALELIMTLLLFVYVIARLALIAQALALLRRQPADAYSVVDWGQFVPHFG